jgi:hypothetical protein
MIARLIRISTTASMKTTVKSLAFLFFISVSATAESIPSNGKIKVFIVSGQSNMVGFGQLDGNPGTMEAYMKSNPDAYGHLVDKDGKRIVRNDVWIVNLSHEKKPQQGWLTTGYGATEGHIGPEYGFGFAVGDAYDDPVLIIKSAWGGRSLFHNFLPPSSEDYPKPEKDGDKGFQYFEVLRHVKEITGDIEKFCPEYSSKDFEIVGFGWHQGWNDRINEAAVDSYEVNMVNFINDMRKDLGTPELPFVIANSGFDGWEIAPRYKAKVEKHLNAQLAPANPEKYPRFKGNVAVVETRDFFRPVEESPSKQGYHWNRNWETLYLIGKSMGDEMVGLLEKKP